jgi:VCBS repeat-containing protein
MSLNKINTPESLILHSVVDLKEDKKIIDIKKAVRSSLFPIFTALSLAACWWGWWSTGWWVVETLDDKYLSWSFRDTLVKGVDYNCKKNGIIGVKRATGFNPDTWEELFLDEKGKFFCEKDSDSILLSIAGLNLWEIKIKDINEDTFVTLMDLLNIDRSNIQNEDVIALARFLQSVDRDSNLENGIEIDQKLKNDISTYMSINDISSLTIDDIVDWIGDSSGVVSWSGPILDLIKYIGLEWKIVSSESAIEHVKTDLININPDFKENLPPKIELNYTRSIIQGDNFNLTSTTSNWWWKENVDWYKYSIKWTLPLWLTLNDNWTISWKPDSIWEKSFDIIVDDDGVIGSEKVIFEVLDPNWYKINIAPKDFQTDAINTFEINSTNPFTEEFVLDLNITGQAVIDNLNFDLWFNYFLWDYQISSSPHYITEDETNKQFKAVPNNEINNVDTINFDANSTSKSISLSFDVSSQDNENVTKDFATDIFLWKTIDQTPDISENNWALVLEKWENTSDKGVLYSVKDLATDVVTIVESVNDIPKWDNEIKAYYYYINDEEVTWPVSSSVYIDSRNISQTPAIITWATTITVSEDWTLTGSWVLNITDENEWEDVFVEQTNKAYTYWTFSIDTSWTWVYNLNNSNSAVQALDTWWVLTDMVQVQSADDTVKNLTVTIEWLDEDPGNRAPTATVNTTITLAEDWASTTSFTTEDLDWDTVTSTLSTNPSHWTVTITWWNINYTPTANYNWTDTFKITYSDGNWWTVEKTFNLTISSVNDAPTATTSSITATEDTAKSWTLTWTDTEWDTLTYSKVSDPSKWTVTINSDWTYTYTPNANATWSDSFSYKVNDWTTDSATQTVSVTIWEVNDAPTATTSSITATEDTAKSWTLTWTDTEWDTLTYSKVSDPSKWTVTINSDWTYTYTPNANATWSDSFSYKVNDWTTDSATQTVSVTIWEVNDAPTATTSSITATEDTAKSWTLTWTDTEWDTLTYSKVSDPSKWTVTINSDWTYTYTPNANATWSDSFSYKVNDWTTDSATQTVSVTIWEVNDAPTATTSSITATEDTAKSWTLTWTDTEWDTLTYSKVSDPSKWTVTINSDWTYTYTPNANATWSDSFSYKVNDWTTDSATQTVSVTIWEVNDAPTATTSSITATEDTAKSWTLTWTDTEWDTLTYSKVSDPSKWTVTINSDWTYTYTPNANATWSDSFSYKVNDWTTDSATQTVSVTIWEVNDAPTATTSSITATEDTAKSWTLTWTDTEWDTLTYSKVSDPSKWTVTINSDWTYTYTPNANATWSDSFSYKVNDWTTDSATQTVSVTIWEVNDAPTATTSSITATEDTAKSWTLTWTDTEWDTLTYSKVSDPSKWTVTINSDWTYTYTPNANATWSDSFSYKVNDWTTDSATQTVSVTIWEVNDAPTATTSSITATEDTAKSWTLTWTDTEWDTLTYSKVSDPSKWTVTINSDWTYTYTPNANATWSDSFSYKVNDWTTDSATQTVSVTIWEVNDAPTATTSSITATEDTAKSWTLTWTDTEWDTLTYSKVSDPSKWTVTINSDWTYTYTPNANATWSDSFSYKVNDWTTDSATQTVSVTIWEVNDAPTATTSSITATEDTAKSWTLTWTDTEWDTLTYSKVSDPSKWTVTINSDWTYTYTPNANATWSDSFSYKVNDWTTDSATQTVSVTIWEVNDAPTATTSSITATEDTAKSWTLTWTDTEWDTLTYSKVSDPSKWTVTINSDWTYTYTPNANATWSDSFSYKVNDWTTDSATQTVSVTIWEVNDAPTATTSSITATEDTAKSWTLTWTDTEWDTLTYSKVSDPSKWTVTINSDWTYTYTPNANATWSDSFSYKVNDWTTDSATQTVSVTIWEVNDAPTATTSSISATEDTAKSWTLTWTDTDWDTLTYSKVSDPSKWTVTINSDWTYTYTPNANATWTDSFSYKVNDWTTDSATQTVSVTIWEVNDAPTATTSSISATEDTAKSWTLTWTDTDWDTLTYSKVSDPSKWTVTINSDWTYTYTPNANATWTDSFSYKVNDWTTDSATQTVSVTIWEVNDAPTATTSSISATEDTAKSWTLTWTDTDWDTLTYSKVSDPSKWTVTINSDWTYTYTPNANATWTDSFSYKVNDWTTDSATQTVSVTIWEVNDAPTATTSSISATEDTAKSWTLTWTDTDWDTLTYSKVSDPSKWTVTINSDWTYTYTPNANATWTDSFSYKVNDWTTDSATQTVSVTIWEVNDAPTATTSSISATEDTAKSWTLTWTDTDWDTLTYSKVSDPSKWTVTINSDWTYTYTPNANATWTDSFSYKVNDWTTDSATQTVSVTIWEVNDAPTATTSSISATEDTAKSWTLTWTDTDWDTLTYSKVSDPSKWTVTINSDWTYTYTPNANATWTDSFSYKVNDWTTDSATQTVSVTIWEVNDAPTATTSSISATEDTAKSWTLTWTDTDWDTLTYSKVSDPSKWTVTINSDWTYTYTPNANATWTDSFSYKVNDWTTDSATQTVSVTIWEVNDAPTATTSSISATEDTAKSWTLTWTDTDWDTLTYSKVSDPSKWTVTINSDWTYTYTPNANATWSDSFSYKVNDWTTDSATQTVSVTIWEVNDAPTATTSSISATEDTAKSWTLTWTDTDWDTLTYSKVSDPSKWTVTINSDWTYTYTPNANATWTDSFSYKVNDWTTDSATQTVSVTIWEVNDAPTATTSSISATEDTAKSWTLTWTDTEWDTLTYSKVSDPSKWTVTINSDWTYTYTPNANATWSDSFSYKVNDWTTDSATQTVSVTIWEVNDAPTATTSSISATEDTAKSWTLTWTDTDWDTLTYSKVSDPSKWTVTINSDWTYTYTPNANATWTDSFSYKVNDWTTDSATQTVSVTIDSVNNPWQLSISWTPQEWQTLSTSLTDEDWSTWTKTYQWEVSTDWWSTWSDISWATSSTYELTTDEIWDKVRTKVSYTDDQWFVEIVYTDPTSDIEWVDTTPDQFDLPTLTNVDPNTRYDSYIDVSWINTDTTVFIDTWWAFRIKRKTGDNTWWERSSWYNSHNQEWLTVKNWDKVNVSLESWWYKSTLSTLFTIWDIDDVMTVHTKAE